MHIHNPQSKEQDDNIQVLKEVPLKFSSRLYFPMTGQSSGNIENIHVRLSSFPHFFLTGLFQDREGVETFRLT